jgi:class 3 adenylate cyclase
MSVTPVPWRSAYGFAAKLLAAFCGVTGLVLVITLAGVRQQTAAQIRAAMERATEQSHRAFDDVESALRSEIALLGRSFMSSPRTVAALEASLESDDMHWLAETARYELTLAMLPRSIAAFTDAAGEPVITLVDDDALEGDAAHLRSLARQLVGGAVHELLAYRMVRGQLYLLRMEPLLFDDRLIGTVTFGLPVDDDVAARIAAVVGAEICFVIERSCIAGSSATDAATRAALAGKGRTGADVIMRPDGRWLRLTESLALPHDTSVRRVIALPLEAVLLPFAEIERVLRITAAASLILALAFSIALSRGLTSHVRALVSAAHRIAHGDYTARVEVRSRDEIGTLTRAFNEMAEGLLLKETYRGILDKVVSPQVAQDLLRGEIRLGGETREVVTLFADITSFSDMTFGMEPQRVITLLNECMGMLENVVQTHGGVVDKYIGDEIMAIFGAPVAGSDDAGQALRAALDMQRAMVELNALRARRSEPPISIRVGVHAGLAVAGNMGSPNRLNYTVIGDAVNLAKRLCSAAEPGQIVVTESTWRCAGSVTTEMQARALGSRTFKGFTAPIAIVAVRARATVRRTAAVATALLVWFAAAPLSAQTEPALRFESVSGALQVELSGRVDVEGYVPQAEPAWLMTATAPLFAMRARLTADVFMGDHLYALGELRADRGHVPAEADPQARVEQALLRVTPLRGRRVMLQAGKFASPFGAYAARHHTSADPLIRPPLPYDHRTLASPRTIPGGLDGFLEWKETARERRGSGAPIVWDVPYPWGALAAFGIGRVAVRAAALTSAPSSAPEAWTLSSERVRSPTLTAGTVYTPAAELTLGAAWSRGPYLETPESGALPDGAELRDFVQETFAFDAGFARGRFSVNAEMLVNRWEVPNLREDPRDLAFYLEASADAAAGLFAAVRYGEIRFNSMGRHTASARAGEHWDLNQQRLQLGGGYRFAVNGGVRAEYMINRTTGASDPADNLLALQLWWSF